MTHGSVRGPAIPGSVCPPSCEPSAGAVLGAATPARRGVSLPRVRLAYASGGPSFDASWTTPNRVTRAAPFGEVVQHLASVAADARTVAVLPLLLPAGTDQTESMMTSPRHSIAREADPTAVAHFRARLRFETDPSDVHAALAGGRPSIVVVDSRGDAAWQQGRVPGAVHLPTAQVPDRAVQLLDLDVPVVTYCWGRGATAPRAPHSPSRSWVTRCRR